MSKIEVVLPTGNVVTLTSNNHTEKALHGIVINRQIVAAKYCEYKGWPADPTQLSFEQILEIRKTKEWIDAGK